MVFNTLKFINTKIDFDSQGFQLGLDFVIL
jgi:hypothetical protein